MSILCTLFIFGLAAIPLCASEIDAQRAEETGKTYKVYKASDGEVYRDVTVTKITDAGVSIMHAEGTARLGFERLNPEQRKNFGITMEDAHAIYAREMKARAAYEAQLAAQQKQWQEEQHKAHQERLAKQKAARLEAERLQAERMQAKRLLAQQALEAQPAQEPQVAAQAQDTTSIVSALEVPRFPIIRGPDNEILYPIQTSSRPKRHTYYRSGGSYGYPLRYGGSFGGHCYPSRGGYYRPRYHRGSYGSINYNGGNWNIGIRW